MNAGNITPLFQSLLESLRDRINANFASRVQHGVRLDATAFFYHLTHRVQPIVLAVHELNPDRDKQVLLELIDLSYELMAAQCFLSDSNDHPMAILWRDCLPTLAKSILYQPKIVAGSLSNAVAALQKYPTHFGGQNSIVDRWIQQMSTHGHRLENAEAILQFGRWAAWLSGLSTMRSEALQVAKNLDADLRRDSLHLGSEDSTCLQDIDEFWKRLQVDRWAFHREPTSPHNAPLFLKALEGYMGIDGRFNGFPSVMTQDDRILVSDGEQAWELNADSFGAILQKVNVSLFPAKKIASTTADKKWLPSIQSQFRWTREATSFASIQGTAAVTIRTSFRIFLFAI